MAPKDSMDREQLSQPAAFFSAYEALVDQLPDGVAVVSSQGVIRAWNRALERISGLPRAEAIGQPLWEVQQRLRPADLQLPGGAEQNRKLFFRLLQGSGDCRLERPKQDVILRQGKERRQLEVTLFRFEAADELLLAEILRDTTDTPLPDLSQHESERRFATLMRSLPGMAYRCGNDPRWTMEYVSEGCLPLTGYWPEELVGNRRLAYGDLIHPEDRQRVWEIIQQAVGEHRSYTLEYRLLADGGAPRWVWERGTAVRARTGEVEALEGFISDISDKRRVEEELRQRVLELGVMQRMTEIFTSGLAPAQELQSLAELIPQAFQHSGPVASQITLAEQSYASAGFRQSSPRMEAPLLLGGRPAGALVLCQLSEPGSASDFGPSDQALLQGIASRLAVFVEREQMAVALAENQLRSQAMLEHLPIPTYIWQRQEDDFVLNSFNGAAIAMTRGAVSRWLGQRASASYAERPDILQDLERCYQEQTVIRRELSYRFFSTGEEYLLKATYGFVPPDVVIVHVEDLTDQRRIEQQLQAAQRLEAVGRFAGGIAHDFNNLLAGINGYSELLLEQLAPDNLLRSDIEEINRAGERAADLTRQLLAFSRRQVLQPKVLDLSAVVRRLEDMLRRLIGEDVELCTELEQALSPVRADPGQMEQVLLNLVINARDAMPQGGQLTIATTNVELGAEAKATLEVPPGRYVRLLVKDNGSGMDVATQAKVFEPFFTTKEPGKGTGLGLAMVYGIVRQSGGGIAIDSAPGRGTSLSLYLPVVDAALERDAPRAQLEAAVGGSETVLVVEDDQTVRSLLENLLQRAGYQLLLAPDPRAAEAISRAHPDQIHLLLTDVVMPGLNGRELAERIRSARPEIKVLYISGYTDDAIVHHGVIDGEVPFLAKPFSATQFLSKVREILDGAAGSRRPPQGGP